MKANVTFVVFLSVVSFAPSLQGQTPVGSFGLFPQWACGAGYSSTIQLTNLGNSAVAANLQFFKSDGTLPQLTLEIRDAAGSRTIEVFDGATQLTIAAIARIKATCSSNVPVVGQARFFAITQKVTGTLVFSYPYNGGTITTSVPTADARRAHSLPVRYSPGSITVSTGLAIANVENKASNVTLSLYNAERQLMGVSPTITLAPNGNYPKFVEEFFPQIKAISEFYGVINVDSVGFTAVMGIQSELDARGFRMDNFPSSPAVNTIAPSSVSRAVCVFPSDVPQDLDCPLGLSQVVQNALAYWDSQMAANNQGSFSQDARFLHYLPSGQIHVDVHNAHKTSAEYLSEASAGFPSLTAELKTAFPDADHFLVWPGPGWSGDIANGTASFIGGPQECPPTFPQPCSTYWKDFLDPEKFLATEGQKWSTTIRAGTWQNTFCYGVHEIGHFMLGHTLTMEKQYTDVENAMRGGNGVQNSRSNCPGIMRAIFGKLYIDDQPMIKQVVIDGEETAEVLRWNR